jgi:hypothetical protein
VVAPPADDVRPAHPVVSAPSAAAVTASRVMVERDLFTSPG